MIPLINGEIQGHRQPLCDARDLHAFLGVGKDFSTWIKDRIDLHGFVEGQDFMVFPNFGENPQGGRPAKEYHLTVEAAKHIAMAEHT
ncbi:anti-repressor protein, partial [Acidithiobacillus sp. GGI-221]